MFLYTHSYRCMFVHSSFDFYDLKEVLMEPYWAAVIYLDFHPQKNILLLDLLMLLFFRKEQLFMFSFWVASYGITSSFTTFSPPYSYSLLQNHFNLKRLLCLVWQLEAFIAKRVTNVITNFDIIDKLGWLESEGNLKPRRVYVTQNQIKYLEGEKVSWIRDKWTPKWIGIEEIDGPLLWSDTAISVLGW